MKINREALAVAKAHHANLVNVEDAPKCFAIVLPSNSMGDFVVSSLLAATAARGALNAINVGVPTGETDDIGDEIYRECTDEERAEIGARFQRESESRKTSDGVNNTFYMPVGTEGVMSMVEQLHSISSLGMVADPRFTPAQAVDGSKQALQAFNDSLVDFNAQCELIARPQADAGVEFNA